MRAEKRMMRAYRDLLYARRALRRRKVLPYRSVIDNNLGHVLRVLHGDTWFVGKASGAVETLPDGTQVWIGDLEE